MTAPKLLLKARVEGLIQDSSVTAVLRFRFDAFATVTWLLPLRLKARPTLPAAKVTPIPRVPLSRPRTSLALPSPGHQLTIPAGAAIRLAVPPSPSLTVRLMP